MSRNGGIAPSSAALATRAGAVRAEVAGDLAGAHGEADEDDVV